MQQCIRTSHNLEAKYTASFRILYHALNDPPSDHKISVSQIISSSSSNFQFPTFSSSFPPKRDGFRSCAFLSSYRVFFSLFLSLFSVIFCLSCCCAWFCCCFRTTWLFRRRCRHFRWCGCDCCAFHSRFSTTRFICTVPLLNFSMNARIFGSQHRVVC